MYNIINNYLIIHVYIKIMVGRLNLEFKLNDIKYNIKQNVIPNSILLNVAFSLIYSNKLIFKGLYAFRRDVRILES